jgi:hypothetical protein
MIIPPEECALFGGFIANNSNVTGLVSAHSVVQSTIAIAPAAAQVSAGGVSLENTTFSGTASANTQASQTMLITGPGDHAAVYVGGIRAK